MLLSQDKPLSFREKKMLERARYLLVSELAMSKNWEEPEVEDMLNKALVEVQASFPGSLQHGIVRVLDQRKRRGWSPLFLAALAACDAANPIIECNAPLVAHFLLSKGFRAMPGTLHIFRLKADPLQYQVNYNLGANSWVQVFEPSRLEEFLQLAAALAGRGDSGHDGRVAQ